KPQENTSLEGLYRSRQLSSTQSEAEGCRQITPYLDRPDAMPPFTTTISPPQGASPVYLRNGSLVASGEDGGRHWVTWHDPFAKPSYLFAMVAGKLECLEDSFVTRGGRVVSLRLYVEAKDLDKCGFAMAALKKAMAWDEQVY